MTKDRMPPATVPRITARNDSDSSRPLPRDSTEGARISGIAPYLAGTKKAECVPIRNTVASTRTGPICRCWTEPR